MTYLILVLISIGNPPVAAHCRYGWITNATCRQVAIKVRFRIKRTQQFMILWWLHLTARGRLINFKLVIINGRCTCQLLIKSVAPKDSNNSLQF